jgi:hypothetical protein
MVGPLFLYLLETPDFNPSSLISCGKEIYYIIKWASCHWRICHKYSPAYNMEYIEDATHIHLNTAAKIKQ